MSKLEALKARILEDVYKDYHAKGVQFLAAKPRPTP